MSEYIRPDRYLEWVDESGLILKNSKKYRILFEDKTSQNELKSRLSILTIFDPTKFDNGKYSCIVLGTSQSIHMSLTIKPSEDGKWFITYLRY